MEEITVTPEFHHITIKIEPWEDLEPGPSQPDLQLYPQETKPTVSLPKNIIKSFKCGEPNCDKTYSSKSHLDRHIYTIHIKKDFDILHRCPECMNTYANRQNLIRHMKIQHSPGGSYVCDVCREVFKKKHQLSAHMFTHTFVKSFSCQLCDKEFASLQERRRHMKYHKTYNCDHCNMVFNHWSKYMKHKKNDHVFTEYICNECGRKFKKRGHIVHHLKTHRADRYSPKIHACPYEGCNRVYTRNSNLRQHIKIKHMEIKHVCEICQAKLSTKAKLQQHITVTHTNPRKVKYLTKATGRQERKDKGIPRTKTALKISGLIVPPKEESNESCSYIEVNPLCEAVLELPPTEDSKSGDSNSFIVGL